MTLRKVLAGVAIVLVVVIALSVGHAWGYGDGLDTGVCLEALAKQEPIDGMTQIPQPECRPSDAPGWLDDLAVLIDGALNVKGGYAG